MVIACGKMPNMLASMPRTSRTATRILCEFEHENVESLRSEAINTLLRFTD